MQDFIRGKACEGPWRVSQALAGLPSVYSTSLSAGEDGRVPRHSESQARSSPRKARPGHTGCGGFQCGRRALTGASLDLEVWEGCLLRAPK